METFYLGNTLVVYHRLLCFQFLVFIFISITAAQILYQCNYDAASMPNDGCLRPLVLDGILISEKLGVASSQAPIAPLSDVTSSRKS